MNLDDFIFTDELAGSPLNFSTPTSPEVSRLTTDHGVPVPTASAIPIKFRPDLSGFAGGMPQSVPNHNEGRGEFHYVKRRVRKTSIDEGRMVRTDLDVCRFSCTSCRALAC